MVAATRRVLFLCVFVCLAFGSGASVASAAESGPSYKEMRKLIKQAMLANDEEGLLQVLRKIGALPGREPVQAVLESAKSIQSKDENFYWFLLNGAAGFRSGGACSAIGDFVVEHRKSNISRDLMNMLQQQKRKPKYFGRIVRRVLEFCEPELQLMALDLSAQIPVRRTVDVLMKHLERAENGGTKFDPEVKKRLIFALEALTKQRFGDSWPNWSGWWSANREKGLKVLRYEADTSDNTTGVVQPIDPIRAREFGLEEIPPGKVLVIKAGVDKRGRDVNYDAIEDVLERLGVKTTVVERDRFANFDIRGFSAIFINCCQINPYCQSPGHQGGGAVGNRLNQCLGPDPHDTAHHGFYCGAANPAADRARHPGCSRENPALLKLRKFVKAGGYLFTEDWVLVEVVNPMWPKFVEPGSKLRDKTGQDGAYVGNSGFVTVRAARGQSSNPLLRGVFVPPLDVDDFDFDDVSEDDFGDDGNDWLGEDEDAVAKLLEKYDPTVEDDSEDERGGGRTGVDPDSVPDPEEVEPPDIDRVVHRWKIDDESRSIKVKSKKVRILMESPELKKVSGDRAVAIAFQYGRGRVLHVLSHFGKQQSVKDQATIENLLVNWLMELRISTE